MGNRRLSAMVEKLGKASVYFSGDTRAVVYDHVEIHPSGVLRVSDRASRNVGWRGTAEGETKAAYYAPHAWWRVEPATLRDYTIWVSDVDMQQADPEWRKLATCVAGDDVNERAQQYLRETYGDRENLERVVQEAFKNGAKFGSTNGDRSVHFAYMKLP